MAYMEKNLEWFKSYLRNRKQYIQIDDKNKTDILSVTCGVSEGSNLDHFCCYFNLMTCQTPQGLTIQ